MPNEKKIIPVLLSFSHDNLCIHEDVNVVYITYIFLTTDI